MPKILIVAATKAEVEPILNYYNINVVGEGLFMAESGDDILALITGVGMVNTAFYMGRYSHNAFDYVINLGIAGAFNRTIKLGEVVNVTADTLSEMGAEDGDVFIKYPDLNLGGTNSYVNESNLNNIHLSRLRIVKSITVNKVHGNEKSIDKTIKLFNPDIESMEGAAFMKAASRLSADFIQLRAISNYVEKRDKSKWDIPTAIKNLNAVALEFIQSL